MKLYKNAIFLFLVVALLSIIYFIILRKNNIENNIQTQNKINILTLDSNDISEIDIDNKKDIFVYKKIKGIWKLTQPSDIRYDQAVADGLPLSIFYASASKKISDNEHNLEQYGLKNPAVITLKESNLKQNVLKIGKLNSTKDSYYVKLDNSSAVYIMNRAKVESILLTKNKVKDKNVLVFRRELRPKMLAEDITEVTLEKNSILVFSAKKNIDTEAWAIVSPLEVKADKNKVTQVLNAISKVLALQFVDDNADDFSQYGLKNPSYSLEFRNSKGVKKLYIGNQIENGSEYYARVEGSNDVFTIDAEGFIFLDRPLKEFIGKTR